MSNNRVRQNVPDCRTKTMKPFRMPLSFAYVCCDFFVLDYQLLRP